MEESWSLNFPESPDPQSVHSPPAFRPVSMSTLALVIYTPALNVKEFFNDPTRHCVRTV